MKTAFALANFVVAIANAPALCQPLDGARIDCADDVRTPNQFFLAAADKIFSWEKPADPIKIVGPIYFVGTEGLGVFLLTTPQGHILMNTGMCSSGPMIMESIRRLGFRPEDIKILINSHAHIDHAGALAFMKQQTGAQVAVMREEAEAIERGDRDDFAYGDDLTYTGVTVDRVLHDRDKVSLGDLTLMAYLTPGHTRGSTTWVTYVNEGGKRYFVVFPDGARVNPGYRLVVDPSYPGIADDYRRTYRILGKLVPDIWLAPHNDYYAFSDKSRQAQTLGVRAWVDLAGYRRFVADRRREFELELKKEKIFEELCGPSCRKSQLYDKDALEPIAIP